MIVANSAIQLLLPSPILGILFYLWLFSNVSRKFAVAEMQSTDLSSICLQRMGKTRMLSRRMKCHEVPQMCLNEIHTFSAIIRTLSDYFEINETT